MKTNNILLYLSLSGLLVFASCNNEELADSTNETGVARVEVVATQSNFDILGSHSRTQIDRWYPGDPSDNSVPKGVAINWVLQDKIGLSGVFTDKSGKEVSGFFSGSKFENKPFTNNDKTGYTDVVFSGEIEYPSRTYYIKATSAYYPYQQNVSRNQVTIEIPSTQTFVDNSSIASYDFKACQIKNENVGGTGNNREFQFTANFIQLATLIRVVLNEEEVREVLGDESLIGNESKTITLQTSGKQALTGTFTYPLTDPNFPFTFSKRIKEENKRLVINVNGVCAEEMKDKTVQNVVYGVVAPINKAELTLIFKYGKYTITLPKIKKQLERGKVYNIGLNKASLTQPGVSITPKRNSINQSADSGYSDGGDVIN